MSTKAISRPHISLQVNKEESESEEEEVKEEQMLTIETHRRSPMFSFKDISSSPRVNDDYKKTPMIQIIKKSEIKI